MTTPSQQTLPSANISRLISAAVVNQGFRQLLLSNPEKALKAGYNGEAFRLDHEEQELILSIQATSLSDFAMKIFSGFQKQNPSHSVRKSNLVA
jgi:hypothetical protein